MYKQKIVFQTPVLECFQNSLKQQNRENDIQSIHLFAELFLVLNMGGLTFRVYLL